MKRITIEEARATGTTYIVTLDGKEVTDRCFEADEEEGYVDLYKLDADGKMFITKAGRPGQERLHGKVKIKKDRQLKAVH
jgi:sugar lactone lactonase YvrE